MNFMIKINEEYELRAWNLRQLQYVGTDHSTSNIFLTTQMDKLMTFVAHMQSTNLYYDLRKHNTSKEVLEQYRKVWQQIFPWLNKEQQKKDFDAEAAYARMLETLREAHIDDGLPLE